MRKQFFILLALALGLSACSPYNYYAVSNKKINNNYKSFAWLPEEKSKATKVYDNDVATDRIIEATSSALGNRGLTLDNKNPDLLINTRLELILQQSSILNLFTTMHQLDWYLDSALLEDALSTITPILIPILFTWVMK